MSVCVSVCVCVCVCVCVFCVCPALIRSLECDSPSQPSAAQACLLPSYLIITSLGCPLGGISLPGPYLHQALSFWPVWRLCSVPRLFALAVRGKLGSGNRARCQVTLARYPMEKGEDRNWNRGRGQAGLTQKSISVYPLPPPLLDSGPLPHRVSY